MIIDSSRVRPGEADPEAGIASLPVLEELAPLCAKLLRADQAAAAASVALSRLREPYLEGAAPSAKRIASLLSVAQGVYPRRGPAAVIGASRYPDLISASDPMTVTGYEAAQGQWRKTRRKLQETVDAVVELCGLTEGELSDELLASQVRAQGRAPDVDEFATLLICRQGWPAVAAALDAYTQAAVDALQVDETLERLWAQLEQACHNLSVCVGDTEALFLGAALQEVQEAAAVFPHIATESAVRAQEEWLEATAQYVQATCLGCGMIETLAQIATSRSRELKMLPMRRRIETEIPIPAKVPFSIDGAGESVALARSRGLSQEKSRSTRAPADPQAQATVPSNSYLPALSQSASVPPMSSCDSPPPPCEPPADERSPVASAAPSMPVPASPPARTTHETEPAAAGHASVAGIQTPYFAAQQVQGLRPADELPWEKATVHVLRASQAQEGRQGVEREVPSAAPLAPGAEALAGLAQALEIDPQTLVKALKRLVEEGARAAAGEPPYESAKSASTAVSPKDQGLVPNGEPPC